MPYTSRLLEPTLRAAARDFPVVIVTGPRRAGKTTLLRRAFPRATYCLLEDPDVVSRIRSDARAFLAELHRPVILDEIQNAPEVLEYVRTIVDEAPRRRGQWLLTGSQESPLMRGVTESLAGRAAVLQLLPLCVLESPRVSLLRGGFPEVIARPRSSGLWFRSYVQTYLERDVRAVTAIRELATFRRFLGLLSTRCGQILNRTDLAAPLGVSVPTISSWLSVLEVTGQIALVAPYYESFGKRLVKSPKLYFLDSGLACFLLGIETEAQLARSPFLGPLFEGWVASEILKAQDSRGRRRELYGFRDQQGLEVDFVVPAGEGRLSLVEAKATRTVRPEMAGSLERLARAMGDRVARSLLVHRGPDAGLRSSAIRPGVRALTIEGALDELDLLQDAGVSSRRR